jgi:hypothetical protein
MTALIKKNSSKWNIILALPVLLFLISASKSADSENSLLILKNGNKRFVV